MVMVRCQAIKRDRFQCNYNSRPDQLYCGVHRNYIPDEMDLIEYRIIEIARTYRISYFDAFDMYREQLNYETITAENNALNNMINSFSSLEIPEESCSICISQPEDLVKTPCCKKEFCSSCLKQWVKFKKNCPTCRATFNPV